MSYGIGSFMSGMANGAATAMMLDDRLRQQELNEKLLNRMEGGSGRPTAPEQGPPMPPEQGPPMLSGYKGEFSSMFDAATQKYGLPSGYLERTAQIESSMNPRARNPNSSAGGLFQFIDSTAAQYNLADRYDPAQATDAAARLAADNARFLKKRLGRDPTAGELYLAHQQGAGGAAKLLADPDAPAVQVVGMKQVKLNGGDDSMSAGDFAYKWTGKFDGSGAHVRRTAEPAGPPMPTQGAPAPPVQRGIMPDAPKAAEGAMNIFRNLFPVARGIFGG